MFFENLIFYHILQDIGKLHFRKIAFLYNLWINVGLSPFLYESYSVHNFRLNKFF